STPVAAPGRRSSISSASGSRIRASPWRPTERSRSRERSELLKARTPFAGSAHCRERLARLLEVRIGTEPLLAHDLSLPEREQSPIAKLALAQANVNEPLDHLERFPRRREHELVPSGPEP